jgi:hypothetical protein
LWLRGGQTYDDGLDERIEINYTATLDIRGAKQIYAHD